MAICRVVLIRFCMAILIVIAWGHFANGQPAGTTSAAVDLWSLAKEKQQSHRFSTIITAQQVRDHLAKDDGIEAALQWCRQTAVTKVYIESFRDGYRAQHATLERARDRLQQAGFEVSGCVTTTQVGKRSTGWNVISCYTDRATQDKLQDIFASTAGLFDEIMIDDFWFTDCKCPECDAARKAKTVTIGERTFPVASDSWDDYRSELLVRLSQERILAPARRASPKVKVIIKYPQWYDHFHERGNPKSLLEMSQADLDRLREPLLAPFGRRFVAPNRVGLYVFADGSWVVDNFRDEPAAVKLDGKPLTVEPRNWTWHWQ